MLAIPLSEAEVCPLLGETLSLAAVNAPSLCIASGPTEAVDELENTFNRQGVHCRRLDTSHAFHSRMMAPVLEPLTEQVKRVNLKPPQIPFVSNVTGTWITPEEATNHSYWARHLCQTVRFMENLHELLQDADRVLLEIGPGHTLCSLAAIQPGNSSRHVTLSSLRHPHDRKSDSAFLLNTLGRLWLLGVKIDWPGFHAGEGRHRISLPTYPFERRRYWIEPPKVAHDDAPSQPEKPRRVSLSKRPDIADWLYTLTWKQCESAKSSSQKALAEQKFCWLVFVDEWGLSEGIVKKLEQTGHEVIRVAIGDRFFKVPDGGYIINPQ
jgi:acyl transferase domain-containing protein